MLFVLHAETDRLCLKDLSSDVIEELDLRLQGDNASMKKLYQFFGLNPGPHRLGLTDLKNLFPDTAVSVLKKCFEALWMYDLADIMEKVRPRSLRPAVSPEQIEKLRRSGNRPTKYHSDVAVLVVKHTIGEEDIVKNKTPEKIETFFKDLNSRIEVAIISLASSQETREVLREIKQRGPDLKYYHASENRRLKKNLEWVLQWKASLEKELEEAMQMEKGRKQRRNDLERELKNVKQRELEYRSQLEKIVKEREQRKWEFEKLKELEKENEKPISTAMDEWIHNKGSNNPNSYLQIMYIRLKKEFRG